jgi:hypothetical protein
LGPGPRGVQQARRWVVDAIKGVGRPELSEAAELGVSELVTNALLHGAPPVSVRLGGTNDHPRVEVHDHSTEPPVLPDELGSIPDLGLEHFLNESDDDDLLVTFGRGLDIVARCAEVWGAEIELSGKIVWFTPAEEVGVEGSPGHVTGIPPAPPPEDGERQTFHLLGVPADWLQEFQRHYLELRREVRLLALAHEEHYPLAKTLSDHFGAMHRQLVHGIEVDPENARPSDDGTVDLVVRLSPDSVDEMGSLVELLDFADEFATRERLLSVARTSAQRTFQTWFLTEFVRQRNGEPPRAWPTPRAYRAQA